MRDRGLLIVVSGFAGAGKGTLMKRLIHDYDNYALSISMTTRKPRPGEENGREYFFVTKEEFEKKIEENGLIEYASYVDNYYGTPSDYVDKQLNQGTDVILEIEIQGALKVKESFPETVLIFVMPPSAEVLKNRLIGRGTETPEIIEKRLKRANQEAYGIENYDFIVINDELDRCVEELHDIIQATHHRPENNKEFIEEVRKGLTSILKGEN